MGRVGLQLAATVALLIALGPRPMVIRGVAAQELLTNESVITLVKSGLGDSVVVAKISTSPARFRLDVSDLVELKAQGVSDRVIEAMLARSRPPAPTGIAVPPGQSDGTPGRTARRVLTSIPAGEAVSAKMIASKKSMPLSIFEPTCMYTIRQFHAILGFEVDQPNICSLVAPTIMDESSGIRVFNYSSIVRTSDNAIEITQSRSESPVWLNQITGKRFKLTIRGRSIDFEDLTPDVQMVDIRRQRGALVSSTITRRSDLQGQSIGTYQVHRFEAKDGREVSDWSGDRLVLASSHAHAFGKCEGTLVYENGTFDFRSNDKPDHSARFGLSGDLRGWLTVNGNGGIDVSRGGKNEHYSLLGDWEGFFDVLIDALIRELGRI